MQWKMNNIFNSTEEIAQISNYPNIRLYKVKLMSNSEAQDDLVQEDPQYRENWAKSNEADKVGSFSAVCLLTAKYMADVLGSNKVRLKSLTYGLKGITKTNKT